MLIVLSFCAVIARACTWAAFARRVQRRRFLLADAAILLLVAAVPVLYAARLEVAAACVTLATVLAVPAGAELWPRLAWVRRRAFADSEQPSDSVKL